MVVWSDPSSSTIHFAMSIYQNDIPPQHYSDALMCIHSPTTVLYCPLVHQGSSIPASQGTITKTVDSSKMSSISQKIR